MNIDQFLSILKIVFPILFGTTSTYFLVIALRGIITRRPFLASNRWLLYSMFVCFIPTILLFLFLPVTSLPEISSFFLLLKWLYPAFFTGLLVMMYFLLKGFTAYGISDITFREALIATLDKLQLSHEETLSSIRLTSVEADLQVSVHSLTGTGMIKIKQREHRTILTQIVSEMNNHFRMSATPSNLTPFIFSLVMDILLLGVGIGFVFFLFQIV